MIRLLFPILSLFVLTCGNPVDHRSDEGKALVTCSIYSPETAKTAAATVRADLIVSNSAGDPVSTTALAFSGKTASGSISLKAGMGYRFDVKGYDSSNNLTYFGSTSNVTIEKGKTTPVSITLVKAGTATVTISGVVTGADGVTVTLSGDMTDSRAVNNGLAYSFTVPAGGNYTVTPSKAGYVFSPANKSFSNLSVNGTQDFTSQAQVSPTVYVKMVSIPGGTFQMGDVEGVGDTKSQPVHTVTVSEFQMSEAEITNAQYCEWLNGALGRNEVTVSGTSVKGTKGTWSGNEYLNLIYSSGSLNSCWIRYENNMFSVVEGKEKLPVVYVTWYGAKAFCMGNGWDLPREAEWEYACRGGKQYKYGTDDGTISSSKANYNANIGSPKDVGSYPKNPFGLYDMSGNLCEWCADWYGSYASGSQIDPTGPQAGSERVFRGGSWPYFDFSISSAYRYSDYPSVRSYDIGFRPVRRVSF